MLNTNKYKMNKIYNKNDIAVYVNYNKLKILKLLKIKYIDLEILLKILVSLSTNKFNYFCNCVNYENEVEKSGIDINKIVLQIQEKLKRETKKEFKINYKKLIEDLDKETIELIKNKFFVNSYCRYEFIKLHDINYKLNILDKFLKKKLHITKASKILINKIYTNIGIIYSYIDKIKFQYKNNFIDKNIKNEITLAVARKEVEQFRHQTGYYMDKNEYWNIVYENLREQRQFEEKKFKEHIKDDPYYEEAKSRFEKLKNTMNNNKKEIKEEEYIYSEDSEYEYYEESSDDEV